MPEITKVMAAILDIELKKLGIKVSRIRCQEIVDRMIEVTSDLDDKIRSLATPPTSQE